MRLLITGGAGYIGSHIVWEALDLGFEITVFDDLSTGNDNNINTKTKFVNGSITSKSDLYNLFKNNSYDVVIHLAGKKSSEESMIKPEIYADNNILGSINLIKECVHNNIKAFVFSSSAAVYGEPEYLPIDESHSLNPTNYYGYTKLVIENNLNWFSNLSGLRYASLRYFNAAGYDIQKRVKGREKTPQNLIPLVMEAANGMRKKVKIYGNNYNTKDGTGVRDYIHVNDLAKAHILAINYIIENDLNLTVNLGTGVGYSVLEIINKTSQISNREIHYEYHDKRSGDLDRIICESTYANNVLNWDTKYSNLETIIKSTWDLYKIK